MKVLGIKVMGYEVMRLKFRMWKGNVMPFPQVRELYGQVLDLFCQFKDLCGQVQELCGQVAGFWRGLHVMFGRTSEAVLSRWTCRYLFWICPLRTRIYVFISPKKHSPPSHRACFILIFSGFWCEGLDFKIFTRAVNAWRGGESKPSHRETALKSGKVR